MMTTDSWEHAQDHMHYMLQNGADASAQAPLLQRRLLR